MRELAVYFCRKCGRYAYFQLPKNAICPACNTSMTQLNIAYQDFMDLGHEERDRLISKEIIRNSPTFVQRITSPDRIFNQRELIGQLTNHIEELEADNRKLNETVEWMHATIWDQLSKMKAMEKELHDHESGKVGEE